MLEASVPRVHRWARLATAEAEMKTTFLFVTENMTALTTGSARAGGIQAFKSDQFAQNQSGLKVTLRTGGCAPGKRRSPLRTPRRSPSLHWPVFTEMKDLLTLVPPLVGLKGNLEMTLASRLSTAANTGQIDDPREQYRVVSSNLALVQVQAAVVGLLAAVAALLLGLASGQGLDVVEAQVLCASSVLTASLAACALGTLMVCIVVGARKLGVNPDNIATPIAASLGDLITLSLLAVVSSFFYRHREPARREDSQVRLVPHRPGDARQQPRGAHLEQDPVPAAVQRHGSLCSHHVWCWGQPGGHSDQPDLHAPAPVGHARGAASLDEEVLAQPLLHVLQLRNQRHVGPRPAGARGARPPGLLLHRLPAGEPVGPEREDLCAPVPAGGPGPGDRPAAPG
ncbi:solute carrier family 41 member 3 isoform X8 [Bos indicus x Bos taurus]|uniref:solute carrier family 41 member 3 isoform X5 n=1 Tax=Bos taurus TaxID=9913 RepID=UPI000D53BAC1|nr:solute carrier family 41 member 3 isoform X5 [Bos taurus]XP_027379367.1 solute carrier family 41 member 3 isoform X8 [Bos indicus x Bos taurus]